VKTKRADARLRAATRRAIALLAAFQAAAAGAAAPRPAPPPTPWKETARFVLDGEPAESLDGALCRPDGTALVWGNAWGTPSDASVGTFACLGTEPNPPLAPVGPKPEPLSLSAPDDPLRTGFLLELGADLKPRSGTRFATGLATVDAAILAGDGGLIAAGMARKGFEALAPPDKLRIVEPPKGDSRFGPIPCRGIEMPGDVYVARWQADRRGLEWAVLLKGHRQPPERLCPATDGRIYFLARTLYALGADGTVRDVGGFDAPSDTASRVLAGAHPTRDALLSCGWKVTRDGGREWVGPLVEDLTLAGQVRQRFYDWSGALVGGPAIDLGHPTPVARGAWMPDGAILIAAITRSEKVVLTADATDPTRGLKNAASSSPIEPLPWWIPLATAPRGIHVARFDPRAPDRGVWTRLMSPGAERSWKGDLTLCGLSAAPDGRVALYGEMDRVEPVGDPAQGRTAVVGSACFVTALAPDLEPVMPLQVLPGVWVRQATLAARDALVSGFTMEPASAAGGATNGPEPVAGCLLRLSP
jgi:hypothetical protein